MREYTFTTLLRYIRVMIRMGVSLRDIGFTEDAVDDILTIASKEIMRIIADEEDNP